ncbi:hypothetical protein ABT025_03555 [Streptomyces sp. NPDC002809]|uniref:hypothetical protein n=1 Tax=Streptomyces sp. NPDC002809 TaxID=3154433 RepID=UPI003324036A
MLEEVLGAPFVLARDGADVHWRERGYGQMILAGPRTPTVKTSGADSTSRTSACRVTKTPRGVANTGRFARSSRKSPALSVAVFRRSRSIRRGASDSGTASYAARKSKVMTA